MAKPDFSKDLLLIHSLITRSMNILIDNSKMISNTKSRSKEVDQGYLDYLKSFHQILEINHTGEDEIGFPQWKGKIPDAPYDKLISQHQDMLKHLNRIKHRIGSLESASSVQQSFNDIYTSLTNLKSIWKPHIEIEEYYFGPENVKSIYNSTEREQFGIAFMTHGRKNAKSISTYVPFLLFNLDENERKIFADNMPGILTKFLYP